MAIANLQEVILASIERKNQLQFEITSLQAQKNLATYSQADAQALLTSEKGAIRDFYKKLYESDESLQEAYTDYTDIPDFEEEIDKITAKFEQQLEELNAWETVIDAQITTNSAELEEINAYLESYRSMLSSNVQEDFDFGLNG